MDYLTKPLVLYFYYIFKSSNTFLHSKVSYVLQHTAKFYNLTLLEITLHISAEG